MRENTGNHDHSNDLTLALLLFLVLIVAYLVLNRQSPNSSSPLSAQTDQPGSSQLVNRWLADDGFTDCAPGTVYVDDNLWAT